MFVWSSRLLTNMKRERKRKDKHLPGRRSTFISATDMARRQGTWSVRTQAASTRMTCDLVVIFTDFGWGTRMAGSDQRLDTGGSPLAFSRMACANSHLQFLQCFDRRSSWRLQAETELFSCGIVCWQEMLSLLTASRPFKETSFGCVIKSHKH